MKNRIVALFAVLFSGLFLPTLSFAQGAVACPELTGLQVAVGFITWMNILKVMAIIGGIFCLGYLLFEYVEWLIEMFKNVPKEVYEVLLYMASFGLIWYGYGLSQTNVLWAGLTGCLLFGISLSITAALHKTSRNPSKFFAILFAVWGITAVVYQNSTIGFIAVAALMGMVGFSVWITPLSYTLGFEDDEALGSATATAFFILVLAVLGRIWGNTENLLNVFQSGALWLGGLVFYLGLLIASTKWYDNKFPYVLMQVLTIAAGMAALGIGSMWDIKPLLGIGGTFFVLYLIEKPFEVPVDKETTYAWIGLGVSICLGFFVWWAQNNMAIVEPYLLF